MANVTVTADLLNSVITANAVVTHRNIEASAELTTVVWAKDHDYYQGDLEFTPTDETQTIATKDLVLSDDIIINPIPSNYGLISWNGRGILVS